MRNGPAPSRKPALPPPAKPAMPECVARIVDVLQSVALAKFPELCGTPAETKINAAIAAVCAYYAQPATAADAAEGE